MWWTIKDIPWYDGRYAVTEDWRVWSYPKITWGWHNWKFLSVGKTKSYEYVTLRKDNKSKTYLLHRVVLGTFIPNPENKPQVNHINWNKHDNRLENLEWCTHSENLLHLFRVLWYKTTEKHRLSAVENWRSIWNKYWSINWKKKAKKIMQLTTEWILCRIYESAVYAWIKNNVWWTSISRAARKNIKYIGYFWKYV